MLSLLMIPSSYHVASLLFVGFMQPDEKLDGHTFAIQPCIVQR